MTAKAKTYAAGNSQKGNLNLSLSSLHSLKNLVRSLVKISGVGFFKRNNKGFQTVHQKKIFLKYFFATRVFSICWEIHIFKA